MVTTGMPTPDGSLRIRPVVLNQFVSDSYQKAIRNLMESRPDVLAPGHGQMIPVTEQMLEATKARIDRRAGFYRKLLADSDTDFCMDARWGKLYSDQMRIAAGASAAAEVRVQDHRPRPMTMEVKPVLRAGWGAEPAVLRFEVPPKGRAACPFRLFTAKPARGPRMAITAEVTVDGKHLGQIAEAVVNLS